MWFLRDASGDKISEFFPSQAKLAVHMQMTPQSLQKAVRKGKNVFQFHGQEVRVVQQTIPQFAVFDFPPRENPLETFELVSEVAKWLKVPAQTVYAAVKRGKETKVKNKEGGVFWLKKLEKEPVAPEVTSPPEGAKPPVPAPRKLSPEVASRPVPAPRKLSPEKPVAPEVTSPPEAASRPVPAPRKNLVQEIVPATPPVPAWLQNFPQLSQNLPQVLQLLQVLQNPALGQNLLLPLLQQQGQGTSPVVLEQKLALPPLAHEIPVTPPIPWAVAEVLKGGNKHPFFPPPTFTLTLFVSPKTVAQFIRSAMRGKMSVQGAKTKKLMLWDNRLIYAPDLIKEFIVFYIREKMFENEKASEFLKQIISDYVYSDLFMSPKTAANTKCLGSVKRLKDEFVCNVTNEFMKLIF